MYKIRLLFLALGMVILVLLFYFIGIAQTFEVIKRINIIWIIPYFALFMSAYAIRSYRWKFLIAPTGYKPKLFDLIRIILATWFINSLIPARLGELLRFYLLKQRTRVPMAVGMASVVIEHLFDLTIIFGLATISCLILFKEFQLSWIFNYLLVILCLILIVIFALIILIRKQERATKIVEKILHLLPRKIAILFENKIENTIYSFNESVKNISMDKKMLSIILITSLLIWFLESVIVFTASIALRCNIAFTAVAFSLLLAALVYIMPLTPGGFGIYEAVFVLVLGLFGIPSTTGLALALVDHTLKFVFIILLGYSSLFWLGVNISEVLTKKNQNF